MQSRELLVSHYFVDSQLPPFLDTLRNTTVSTLTLTDENIPLGMIMFHIAVQPEFLYRLLENNAPHPGQPIADIIEDWHLPELTTLHEESANTLIEFHRRMPGFEEFDQYRKSYIALLEAMGQENRYKLIPIIAYNLLQKSITFPRLSPHACELLTEHLSPGSGAEHFIFDALIGAHLLSALYPDTRKDWMPLWIDEQRGIQKLMTASQAVIFPYFPSSRKKLSAAIEHIWTATQR